MRCFAENAPASAPHLITDNKPQGLPLPRPVEHERVDRARRKPYRIRFGTALFSQHQLRLISANAVEFYNAAQRHYFITAYAGGGRGARRRHRVPGWCAPAAGSACTIPDRTAVRCAASSARPGVGPDSHFYTADPAECAKVKTYPAWTYEAIAFYIRPPSTGGCKPGTEPVCRKLLQRQHRAMRITASRVDLTAHVRMPQRRGDCSKAW